MPAPSFMVKPLKTIPKSMDSDFTYNGRIQVKPWYFEENFPTNRTTGKISRSYIHDYLSSEPPEMP